MCERNFTIVFVHGVRCIIYEVNFAKACFEKCSILERDRVRERSIRIQPMAIYIRSIEIK